MFDKDFKDASIEIIEDDKGIKHTLVNAWAHCLLNHLIGFEVTSLKIKYVKNAARNIMIGITSEEDY